MKKVGFALLVFGAIAFSAYFLGFGFDLLADPGGGRPPEYI